MRKLISPLLKAWCKRRLDHALPGIQDELRAYSKGSDTTGTQWVTLWLAVRGILRHRPEHILECGTGASTIVLASAVKKAQQESGGAYRGLITSMESMKEWYDVAVEALPDKYQDVVEIVHGPREPYNLHIYRGYIHSNIPKRDYSFVFLDGPFYKDDRGHAFCGDAIHAFEHSTAREMRGVIDGRFSSAYVMRRIYGAGILKYFPAMFACDFVLPRTESGAAVPDLSYKPTLSGRVKLLRTG